MKLLSVRLILSGTVRYCQVRLLVMYSAVGGAFARHEDLCRGPACLGSTGEATASHC